MAKKITVKMLKEGGNIKNCFSGDNLKDLIDEAIKKVDKMFSETKFGDKDLLKPFDIDDQFTYDYLAGIGFVYLIVVKSIMTPSAWKYYVEKTLKEIKN